jgi:hypothetical protein
MKLKHLYLIIAILGTIIPSSHFLPFLVEHGFGIGLFAESHGLFNAGFYAGDF